MGDRSTTPFTRREMLKRGGAVAAAAGVSCTLGTTGPADAQAPKRGGTFRLRSHVQPVHFDPHQTIAFSTMIPLSFAYSRLVRVKAGSAVVPGTQPIEGDLAESWTQPNETTYVFKLRRGVRWHPKPPVNGRELTAEDVKYTYERFLTIKGNGNRGMLEQVDKIETPDKHTVRFILKEPFAWFIEALGSTSTWIIARECVEQFGDLKKPESVVGTGPGCSSVRAERRIPSCEPNLRRLRLPHADGVESRGADRAAACRLHRRQVRIRPGVRHGR